jgi:hypothetical protein
MQNEVLDEVKRGMVEEDEREIDGKRPNGDA